MRQANMTSTKYSRVKGLVMTRIKVHPKSTTLAFLLILSCTKTPTHPSSTKSDWENAQQADKSRTYVVDWSCEPKRFGSSAESNVGDQEEYCEWQTVKVENSERTCRFTTSFDTTRSFHLNSREETPFNTVDAARILVQSCAENATARLEKGLGTGKLCSDIPNDCVDGRNSDPEICDKIRWTTKERFEKRLDYCVDQLPTDSFQTTTKPLMQFGILTDIPANCRYTTDDKTEVDCTVPADESCFSIAGQLRVGLRVHTRPFDSEAKLPTDDACYRPSATQSTESTESREVAVPVDGK
jgi:hypothetical protein